MWAGDHPLAPQIPELGWGPPRGAVVPLDWSSSPWRELEDRDVKWKVVVVVVASLQDDRQSVVGSLRVEEGSVWSSWDWRVGS